VRALLLLAALAAAPTDDAPEPHLEALLLVRSGRPGEAILLVPGPEPGTYTLARLGGTPGAPATYSVSRITPPPGIVPGGGDPIPEEPPPDPVPPASDPAAALGADYARALLEGQARALEGPPEGLRAALDAAFAAARGTLNVALSRSMPDPRAADAPAFLRRVADAVRGAVK
jgi:hypothetical protein